MEISYILIGCENEGLTQGSHCERCNQVLIKQEEIECLGHTYSDYEIVTSPICEKEGLEKKICTKCNDELFNTIEALEHEYSEFEVVTPASCEKEGLEKKVCTKCNKEVFQTIAPLEHEYSEFEIVTPATCELEGVEKKVCTKCYKEVLNKIPAKDHNLTYDGYKASTCVTTGQTDTTYCIDCQKIITPSKELELSNHTWEIYNTVESTYGSIGRNYFHCTVCQKTKSEFIPILKPQIEFFDTLLTQEMLNQNIRIYLEEDNLSYEYIVLDNITYYSKQIYEDTKLTTEKHYFIKLEESKAIRIDYVDGEYTHSVYTTEDSDLINLQNDFINKVTCLKEIYDKFKWYGNPSGGTDMVNCYDGELHRVHLDFTEDGILNELYLTGSFTLECYYEDIELELPININIHSKPTNNICPGCNLTCKTASIPTDTYIENYYIYEDGLVTYEYILTDETTTACSYLFRNRKVTYNEEHDYYKIDQLKYTSRSIYSKAVKSYSYSSLTGIITVELDTNSTNSTVYFYTMDNEIEYSEDGYFLHSGGYNHPEDFMNKTFIEYTTDRIYLYTFSEGFYTRETYYYATVYLYKGKAFGKVFGEPLEYFLDLEEETFMIDEEYNHHDVKTIIEDLSITITISNGSFYQGTIYDIDSKTLGDDIIYFISGDGKKYMHYLNSTNSTYMGKVIEIE